MGKEFVKYLLVALTGVLSVTAFAAGDATLTRSQWLKKIGDSVSNEAVLTETLSKISAGDRVEFSQRLYKAIARLPVTPEQKSATFVKAAVKCITGVKGKDKQEVIAVVFSDIPIDYLPIVTEALAKRFNQELNKLSDADFEKIAKETLAISANRNAKTDEPSVRDAFAMLAFLRAAKKPAPLQKTLIAQLPDDHTKKVVADLVPGPLANGKYDDLLSAAGVEEEPIVFTPNLSGVGHVVFYGLLADMNANQSIAEAKLAEGRKASDGATLKKPLSSIQATAGVMGGTSWSIHDQNYGIYRVPRPREIEGEVIIPGGYQNQSWSIFNYKKYDFDFHR